MATLTITIPCATDPFPYYICLAFGDSSCPALCAGYDLNACNN